MSLQLTFDWSEQISGPLSVFMGSRKVLSQPGEELESSVVNLGDGGRGRFSRNETHTEGKQNTRTLVKANYTYC